MDTSQIRFHRDGNPRKLLLQKWSPRLRHQKALSPTPGALSQLERSPKREADGLWTEQASPAGFQRSTETRQRFRTHPDHQTLAQPSSPPLRSCPLCPMTPPSYSVHGGTKASPDPHLGRRDPLHPGPANRTFWVTATPLQHQAVSLQTSGTQLHSIWKPRGSQADLGLPLNSPQIRPLWRSSLLTA